MKKTKHNEHKITSKNKHDEVIKNFEESAFAFSNCNYIYGNVTLCFPPIREVTDIYHEDKTALITRSPFICKRKMESNFLHKLGKKNICKNYGRGDYNQLQFLKCMINKIEEIFQENRKTSDILEPSILVSNLQHLNNYWYTKYKYIFFYSKDKYLWKGKLKQKENIMYVNPNESNVLYTHFDSDAFDNSIDGYFMGSDWLLRKYMIPNILAIWSKLGNLSRQSTIVIESSPMAAKYTGKWYFRNGHQGSIINVLLRYCHVNALKVVKSNYFILITDINSYFKTRFNFLLNVEMFSFEICITKKYLTKALEWRVIHINILKRRHIATPCHLFNAFPKDLSVCEITCVGPPSSDLSITAAYHFLQSMLHVIPSVLNRTKCDSSKNILAPSLPVDHIFIQEKEEEKSGIRYSQLLQKVFMCSSYKFPFALSQVWPPETDQWSKIIKDNIHACNLFRACQINECIFEATSIDLFEDIFKPLYETIKINLILNVGKSLLTSLIYRN